jgi:hypothetical protein
MRALLTTLDPMLQSRIFLAEYLTPDYSFNDHDHDLDPDHGNLEVTPEMVDNYLSAEISVPHGGTLVKGHITSRR